MSRYSISIFGQMYHRTPKLVNSGKFLKLISPSLHLLRRDIIFKTIRFFEVPQSHFQTPCRFNGWTQFFMVWNLFWTFEVFSVFYVPHTTFLCGCLSGWIFGILGCFWGGLGPTHGPSDGDDDGLMETLWGWQVVGIWWVKPSGRVLRACGRP